MAPPPVLSTFQRAQETAQHITTSLPVELLQPKVAIVCGSGLSGLAHTVHSQPRTEIKYVDLPNFPQLSGSFIPYFGRSTTLTLD